MIWQWVYHDGQRLHDVGILADGTLHNPRGYDAAIVREAVERAERERHERRSAGAKQAALTKKRRAEQELYLIVNQMVAIHRREGRKVCRVCSKPVYDVGSVAWRICPACWSRIVEAAEAILQGTSQQPPAV
jgi:hypothetical protein